MEVKEFVAEISSVLKGEFPDTVFRVEEQDSDSFPAVVTEVRENLDPFSCRCMPFPVCFHLENPRMDYATREERDEERSFRQRGDRVLVRLPDGDGLSERLRFALVILERASEKCSWDTVEHLHFACQAFADMISFDLAGRLPTGAEARSIDLFSYRVAMQRLLREEGVSPKRSALRRRLLCLWGGDETSVSDFLSWAIQGRGEDSGNDCD